MPAALSLLPPLFAQLSSLLLLAPIGPNEIVSRRRLRRMFAETAYNLSWLSNIFCYLLSSLTTRGLGSVGHTHTLAARRTH